MMEQISLFQDDSRWAVDIDNETQMLRCDACGGRVIRQWYDRAVGDKGFRHCPYCGRSMANAEQMAVPWPGYSDNPNRPGAWIPMKRGEPGYSAGDFRCSKCGKPNRCYILTDYCPNCGERMKRGT